MTAKPNQEKKGLKANVWRWPLIGAIAYQILWLYALVAWCAPAITVSQTPLTLLFTSAGVLVFVFLGFIEYACLKE